MILKIDRELAQGLVNYLQERPYQEVALLIEGLLGLEPIPDEPEAEPGGPGTPGVA